MSNFTIDAHGREVYLYVDDELDVCGQFKVRLVVDGQEHYVSTYNDRMYRGLDAPMSMKGKDVYIHPRPLKRGSGPIFYETGDTRQVKRVDTKVPRLRAEPLKQTEPNRRWVLLVVCAFVVVFWIASHDHDLCLTLWGLCF